MKKILAIILFCAVLVSSAACGNSSSPDDTTAPQTSGDTTSAPEETEEAEKLDLPDDLNYGGYVFRIRSRPSPRVEEVLAEEENGDNLNDAVYRRNIMVEDKLGIKFEVIQSSDDAWDPDALNTVLAGEDAYDAIACYARASFDFAAKGAVHNLYDIENLDLTKSWWSQSAAESLTINGKLYSMVGDISHATLSSSVGMVFNKQLFDDYQLKYPYELVDSGEWTFDVFDSYARKFSQDLNGDGEMNIKDDLFGYGSNHWLGPIEALYCTGNRIITTNDEGYPELTLYSEKVVDMYDKYMSLILSECGWNQLAGTDHQEAFCEGRVAMVDLGLAHLSRDYFRDATIEFGLVPWPKSDESVDKYYSFVDAGQTMWTIPVTNQDTARTGAVLETMAYYGQKMIIPAYYDVTLQNKYLRDERSVDMLDYIREGAIFDLGYYNNTQFGGNLANPGYDLVHNTKLTFTTLYNKNEQSVKTLIDKSMKSYLE